MPEDHEKSRLLTLVFTDLVASTSLKSEKGDKTAGVLIARHRESITRLADGRSGRIVDWAGDGCFLTFETPSSAVSFALALQAAQLEDHDLPKVRIGVHVGEVSEGIGPDGPDGPPRIEGLAVDLAARVQSLALPGQVLMTSAAFNSARQRLESGEFDGPIAWLALILYV